MVREGGHNKIVAVCEHFREVIEDSYAVTSCESFEKY
jgi:hypothetical protein